MLNETLRGPLANSSVHFIPAMCHKVLGKLRQFASRNQGTAFLVVDKVNVMCYSGIVVLEWIFVSVLADTPSVGCRAK